MTMLGAFTALAWLFYVSRRRAGIPEWLSFGLAMTIFFAACAAIIIGSGMIYADAANRCERAGGHLVPRTGQCVEGRVIHP